MSLFNPAPEPPTPLGRHRILSPTAGIKVSPLCLGAMNFGNSWKEFMGECSKETAYEMLDFFRESGGNFIDTANNYQSEESEQWLGDWMKERGCRDEMVIATKFTTNYRAGKDEKLQSNYVGNNKKSLTLSVNASLKKLKTEYIDLLYLHWWDETTSIAELMQSLHHMIQSGKVLYLGISDTPAWVVAKANEYARNHGLTQFSVFQGNWSAAKRDMESEIIPMCQAEGMAIAPWGALGGGNFKTEEQRKSNEGRNLFPPSEADLKVSEVLEKLARKKNTVMTSVALAYVMHQAPDVYPIVGGRKVEHLKGNIEALKLRLSKEELEEIENAYGYQNPFPQNFIWMGEKPNPRLNASDVLFTRSTVRMDVARPRGPAFTGEHP